MVAALGVALRTTTAVVGLAPAMMKTIEGARPVAVEVHRASTTLLRAATLLAVAAVSLHAVVSAWGVATCPPAVAPQ